MYRYLTGPQFRHRVSAVVERFIQMQADLARERRVAMKQFAKREGQIKMVIGAMARMVGICRALLERPWRKSRRSRCRFSKITRPMIMMTAPWLHDLPAAKKTLPCALSILFAGSCLA
jgi:Uncharacterized protein conserved in bacteria (DUF2130)